MTHRVGEEIPAKSFGAGYKRVQSFLVCLQDNCPARVGDPSCVVSPAFLFLLFSWGRARFSCSLVFCRHRSHGIGPRKLAQQHGEARKNSQQRSNLETTTNITNNLGAQDAPTFNFTLTWLARCH